MFTAGLCPLWVLCCNFPFICVDVMFGISLLYSAVCFFVAICSLLFRRGFTPLYILFMCVTSDYLIPTELRGFPTQWIYIKGVKNAHSTPMKLKVRNYNGPSIVKDKRWRSTMDHQNIIPLMGKECPLYTNEIKS